MFKAFLALPCTHILVWALRFAHRSFALILPYNILLVWNEDGNDSVCPVVLPISLSFLLLSGGEATAPQLWSGGIQSWYPDSLPLPTRWTCDLTGHSDWPRMCRFPSRTNEDPPRFLMNRRAWIVSAKYISFYLWQSSLWRVWLP